MMSTYNLNAKEVDGGEAFFSTEPYNVEAACEMDRKSFMDMKARIGFLEKKNEDWGRRCDEADDVERQLRLQQYDLLEKWKDERAALTAEIEKLKTEKSQTEEALKAFHKIDNEEKFELEALRSEKKLWMKEKKRKNEEIASLTSRVIALRNELRRYAGNCSDELSPSVTLCNIIVSENIGDVTTPTKLLGYEPVLPVTSKRKSIMSKLSCRRGLPSKPFDISGSP